MNKLSACVLISACIISCVSCNNEIPQKKIITVTIEPQRYFAEQLADSLFEIEVMVPPGSSPESYDPSPVQMARLADSRAYFRIGAIGFEGAWMDQITANNPTLPVYDNSYGISFITGDEHAGHSDHQHSGADPHIWSSPKEALVIVENMCNALTELDPANSGQYVSNRFRLEEEIRQTDRVVTDLLHNVKSRSFLIYHPALTYFAKDYGLNQLCIEEDQKEPSPGQLKNLVEKAKSENVKVIFIQSEFDQKNAEIIARETGCKLMVINPLSYNWSEEIIQIAKALSGE